jgi:hypothetical protein
MQPSRQDAEKPALEGPQAAEGAWLIRLLALSTLCAAKREWGAPGVLGATPIEVWSPPAGRRRLARGGASRRRLRAAAAPSSTRVSLWPAAPGGASRGGAGDGVTRGGGPIARTRAQESSESACGAGAHVDGRGAAGIVGEKGAHQARAILAMSYTTAPERATSVASTKRFQNEWHSTAGSRLLVRR